MPIWYQVKVVADWHNISVADAWQLPYAEWLEAFAGKSAESLGEQDYIKRQQMSTRQRGRWN